MAKILCMETATQSCSAALVEGGRCVLSKTYYDGSYAHNEKLHELIAELKLDLSALDAVAVSMGPGSYTGLRIGVSAAKGLCFALGIPLITVPTLAVMAKRAVEEKPGYDFYIPMIDARRMEVFTAVFNHKPEQVADTEAKILDSASYSQYPAKGRVLFCGDGASKFKELCSSPDASFLSSLMPDACFMAEFADKLFRNKNFADTAYFEPFYLKEFISPHFKG